MRLPRDRMRSGVPLVVSLRRSPEGSILKAVQYRRELLERKRRQSALLPAPVLGLCFDHFPNLTRVFRMR